MADTKLSRTTLNATPPTLDLPDEPLLESDEEDGDACYDEEDGDACYDEKDGGACSSSL